MDYKTVVTALCFLTLGLWQLTSSLEKKSETWNQYDGPTNEQLKIFQFGAHADGVHDDTKAVQKYLNYEFKKTGYASFPPRLFFCLKAPLVYPNFPVTVNGLFWTGYLKFK